VKHTNRTVERYHNLVTHTDPRSAISEAYRTLRTNIQFAGVEREIRVMLVTSTGPSEGKSTTSANLAIVMAQSGKKVLLVDADMRKPTAHQFFRTANRFGLSHLLAKQSELHAVVQPTFVEGLDLLSSGPIPPNPAELLGSTRMNAALERMKEAYDFVIIDTPPVVAVTDAQVLASKVDGVLLVINAGKTSREMAMKAKHLLDNVHANILGTVLNRRKMGGDGYSYYYYYGSDAR
jgi:protein-tyrosine kinase